VVQAPIAREVPGVEEHSGRSSPIGSPQPRDSSTATLDHQFRSDLLIAIVALAGIAVRLLLRFGLGLSSRVQFVPLYVVLALGGIPLVFRLIQRSLAGEFGSDLLAGISIVASACMGQFLVGREAEIAVLAADQFQRCGLGAELLERLVQIGRDDKLERLTMTILPENMAMRALAARYGFEVEKNADLSEIRIALKL
jgi:ribosomal protein S18 acetylase RimI-like enzyme